MLLCIVLLCTSFMVGCLSGDPRYYNTPELAYSQGYNCLNHTVVTEDNYLLTVFRLFKGSVGTKGTVLLQHGMLDTSSTWVINDRSTSLAFILVDAGFDVWLANSRGNKYALRHVYYTPDDPPFWDFDWDHHAHFDVPATVAKVLAFSNSSQLHYVAHSQGATIGLASLLRGYGQLRTQLKSFVGLAPVTYTAYQDSPLLSIMTTLHIDKVLSLNSDAKFNPTPQFLSKLLGVTCTVTPSLCNSVLSSLFGDQGNLNSTRMGVYLAHWPDNTSVRNMIHWIQNVRNTQFVDYNEVPYAGTISLPTFIAYGSGDALAQPSDVQTLLNQLPHSISSGNGYAHMDFVWSERAAREVYPKVVNFLRSN